MSTLDSIIDRLTMLLKIVGAFSLAGMMLLTCVDVTMRALGHPLLGAVELVGFMATMVLACAMPYTHRERGHIGVDMVVRKLSPVKQSIIDGITGTVAFVFFLIVSWRTVLYSESMRKSGEVSMTLQLPSWIIIAWVALAFVVLSATIALDVVKAVRKAAAHE